ncbi:DUF2339 domain-containing protein [Rhodohalobacter sp.]|uniref:DUF2339 domain-containing protein n=1 Tax=Rhodohalobacter sp. TaxID=1974210 RepID=UPI003566A611
MKMPAAMDRESSDDSGQDRIKKLEDRVAQLEKIVGEKHRSSSKVTGQATASETAFDDYSNKTKSRSFSSRKSGNFSLPQFYKDNWLYWIGVSLLLLGVVFLFNYSIEQGWLIPPIRSAFGLLIGSTLFWLGFSDKIAGTIRQFLMGAGIGALYITGFATFQLYSFLSYPIAFSFMIAVTILSFGTSLRQNSSTLALIGTLGGLATPFMLYENDGSLLMLMLYSCTIMTGAAAIYQFKQWGSLLWSMFVGGSLILLIALVTNVLDVTDPLFADRWILQSGLLYMLSLVWLLPVVRELSDGAPNMVRGQDDPGSEVEEGRRRENPHIQALSLLIPILAVQFMHGVWSLSEPHLGILALGASFLTGSICIPLRKAGFRELSTTHMFSALVLFTQAMFLFFEGNMLLVVITLEALALRYAATRFSGKILSLGSHLLVLTAWVLMAGQALFSLEDVTPILNMQAMSELLLLVSTGLIIPIYLYNSKTAEFYQLVAHIGLLAWFSKEFTYLDSGQMVTSIAWGIYAVLILISGFWLKKPKLRGAGMATILLVVGKLFFVDLSQTSALLRIPLFMGFGVLLLLIGYLLQKYWSEDDPGDGSG